MEIYCVKDVEQNPLPKSQTKPFYIGTKEAPSDTVNFTFRLAQFCKYTCMCFAIYHKCTQDILMERVRRASNSEYRGRVSNPKWRRVISFVYSTGYNLITGCSIREYRDVFVFHMKWIKKESKTPP